VINYVALGSFCPKTGFIIYTERRDGNEAETGVGIIEPVFATHLTLHFTQREKRDGNEAETDTRARDREPGREGR
jgi:hypothetical protein